jgi:hypothetical protein
MSRRKPAIYTNSYAFHSEIYDHKNGKQYLVEVERDAFMGPPNDEHDCHGRVLRDLDFDPSDPVDLDDYMERYYAADDTRTIEDHARFSMLRLLNGRNNRAHNYIWYDVWESLKLAKTEWGHKTDEDAQAAVEADFKFLHGWYDDEWFWCMVSVYAIGEDGEPEEESVSRVGGYESLMLDGDRREEFEEVIEDGIANVEMHKHDALHRNQLKLPLT